MDKIKGLMSLWTEADSFAEVLGYPGHFDELKSRIRIEFPTGLSKNEDPLQKIQQLEEDVLRSPYKTKPAQITRVRSLSIQESPFRSRPGRCCSTEKYFAKALDPNYYYFTRTDENHQSSGQLTVVLGTALNEQTGLWEKVAFADKLQNVPNQEIETFLDAVARSLATRGYQLGIPTDLGADLPGHGGLSNTYSITHFVQTEIMPRLHEVRKTFTPHSHSYQFANMYSRGDQKLEVRIFKAKPLEAGTEIKPGMSYRNFIANKDLNKQKLVQELINLRNSPEEQDVLKYVSSGQMISQLEKLGLFSQKEFLSDLGKIVNDTSRGFQVRRQAFYEVLLL
jgi:hypothetical protein